MGAKPKIKSSNIFIALGLLLIGAALLIAVYNMAADKRAEQASQEAVFQLKEQISAAAREAPDNNTAGGQPLYKSHRDMEMPLLNIDGVSYIGVLKIPGLGLELPIRGDFSYPDLVRTPCRYYGSAYQNNMIIAGHNYASHFGYIRRLSIGDSVSFTDGDGNEFFYRITEFAQINGDDVQGMKEGDWDMTIFTCNVSGQKRIAVRLELAEDY